MYEGERERKGGEGRSGLKQGAREKVNVSGKDRERPGGKEWRG